MNIIWNCNAKYSFFCRSKRLWWGVTCSTKLHKLKNHVYPLNSILLFCSFMMILMGTAPEILSKKSYKLTSTYQNILLSKNSELFSILFLLSQISLLSIRNLVILSLPEIHRNSHSKSASLLQYSYNE